MKATKLELQQTITKLAADNQFLREQLSKIQTERDMLVERSQRAEHAARRVIIAHNHPPSERRLAMDAAREAARKSGVCVKVEG